MGTLNCLGVRQRSGEGVVRRNGRPKGCFGESILFPLKVFKCFQGKANLTGAEKKQTLQKHLFPRTTPSALLWRALIVLFLKNHNQDREQKIAAILFPGSEDLGLPLKQNIGVKKCWAQKFEFGEECRRFGV